MSFLVEHAHNKRIEELEREVGALKRFIAAMFPRPVSGAEVHIGQGSGKEARERVLAAYDELFHPRGGGE